MWNRMTVAHQESQYVKEKKSSKLDIPIEEDSYSREWR
jgi:hypothetical protein